MLSVREVNKQLKSSGYYYRFWMRKEIRELTKVLDEGETIKQCVNGYYQGGLALLAATDRRLLLVDYKPMYLTLEIIWYDKIGQIDYSHRMLNASICISTPNKELNFTSYDSQHLRKALMYTQEKIADSSKSESQEVRSTPSNMSYRGKLEQDSAEVVIPALSVSSIPSANDKTNLDEQLQNFVEPSTIAKPVTESAPSFESSSTKLPFSHRRYFAAAVSSDTEPIV